MKIGIDSYCYHRYFGEVYPQQTAPSRRMTMPDFLRRAHELRVDGVSLESCFFPSLTRDYLLELKGMLDEYSFDRVYAWGHPDGLEGGSNHEAFEDMLASIERAQTIGADVMRVVGSSLRFRHEPHGPQIDRLSRMFSDAIALAERHGVRLAVENHIDFNAAEMLELIQNVGSPYLGINFDTGNFVRLLDDPLKGMERLAPHVYATHIKDLRVQAGVAPDEWYFFSSVPLGEGFIDNHLLAELLRNAGYRGFLAVEIDFLHPGYGDEDAAVAQSIDYLRALSRQMSS